MTQIEYTCLPPFVNVILTCDICEAVTTNRGNRNAHDHVVELVDGRTICNPCFQKFSREAEGGALNESHLRNLP